MKYKVIFNDIELAYEFVSYNSYRMNSAILKLTTGKINKIIKIILLTEQSDR